MHTRTYMPTGTHIYVYHTTAFFKCLTLRGQGKRHAETLLGKCIPGYGDKNL